MRIAVTVAIVLGVINLAFFIWQAQADEPPVRTAPTYNSPVPEYRAPIVYPRNDPDYVGDFMRRSEIRRLEDRLNQVEQRQMWENIYPNNR